MNPASAPPLKHGAAAGALAPAHRADWTIEQNWAHYTEQEHRIWQTLFERQSQLLAGRVCDEFLAGMRALPIDAHQIPDFRQLNAVLLPRTSWQIVAVSGLVPDEVFFEHLANRRFPAGQFIRTLEQLDYLEEPDVFHDVFGHVPMLMNPALADFMQFYGVTGLRAQQLGVLPCLARLYWYTVEFGLVQQGNGLRIYGAGIATSFSETVFALEDSSPQRLGFELERVMRTLYRIDDFQPEYFVLEDLSQLLALTRLDFEAIYPRVQSQAVLQPGELLATDQVLQRGSGCYHRSKRQASQEI